ncbi:carbamoyl-phosphate synthase large subunit [Geobacter sulfurreducens]|uniref:Carbamoyl phosphate synthase large chain n=1 Tax=Geobacter sulfurreducens (strain ATCC 51573 / DSM 12127 / PCA) TaxID=243231 RepID=Q74DP0_GEOSL|nr:carbamoyl-phosphate synthase large subunit [Geobacter sulfurreducens]AAR34652.1 carbamyl-phosphate synthase, large subunit lipoprotein, glutamine-dependent [Geobacter sulfurreducens PCA]ADI84111.1 carbamyl-phosphate synthase, large subunit, glutamine-dependent [Geobacter sulfurreducens KN400]AJY70986.1 carbamoyl phosphate synthase large subunit [Geobacter sulfurreducens]QVW36490.1 carbamoyl-phosphate synthase large subunit [Geobacter sulfurreducens]UAC05304.1 carbamoyl-phosphate synthase la
MPKRTDIKKILIIGAGPIVIGQACEFDYSGTQACKALKEEGFEVVLLNSNPATIMTDPDFADRTYVEPVTPEVLAKIIEKERPDAVLPTLGGQTALNTAVAVAENGTLEKFGVELIGAKLPAIKKAEDRTLFKEAMEKIGLSVPRSGLAHNYSEAMTVVKTVGFPAIIRPSFTLGGTGGGIAYNMEEYEKMAMAGIDASPTDEILVEESVIGWKEYELEVMRDTADNVVIICSIENFDPMGVHTGDSITVAPAQTLTDKEYQILRDAALKIIREIGVDTGGSNIQFGINPRNGRLVVIEMNPRVSRSSALASKATGFPIAKIAAKLAVGYTLDEIRNDITRETPACFEPTIDYVVTKIPRFTFEKFPAADATLTTQMKSVGEVMAIGRTFKESFQKALRSLEIGSAGFESRIFTNGDTRRALAPNEQQQLQDKLRVPNWERLWYLGDAFRCGMSIEEVFQLTAIDPWFLHNIKQIIEKEEELRKVDVTAAAPDDLRAIVREAKQYGFSDRMLGRFWGKSDEEIRQLRLSLGIKPVFKRVDTCAAEFVAYTPYLYSTYEDECEAEVTDRKKIMILGGGPNRIGQGIEFDYCCVHGVFALAEDGYETIMVNCNPETVSTDYDTSDRLYFEPLTYEDVLSIVELEKPEGVIVQFGGQTPLKLAVALEKAGVPIIGTSPDAIDRAEDRERFQEMLHKLNLLQPENGTARSFEEAEEVANRIGYPVVVRPSYVLGGRAMEIVYDVENLRRYMTTAVQASPEHPILIDKFLDKAIEIDVDALCDGTDVVIGGIMEHIEEAGIHSGDSACCLPPHSISQALVEEIRRQTTVMALELNVKGLMNVQYAIKDGTIYILEVNPRASRTAPFVSKATGRPLAKIAARVMAGRSLKDLGVSGDIVPKHMSVKEAVFPFVKFPGVDTLLGPEMKSTGEVMGIGPDFATAFAKAQLGANVRLPRSGKVFISLHDADKKHIVESAKKLYNAGFRLVATRGTAAYLKEKGVEVEVINKVLEGRPHVVDAIKNGEICMVLNTTQGAQAVADSFSIRREALMHNVAYFTTVAGANAAAGGIVAMLEGELDVKPLQEYLG